MSRQRGFTLIETAIGGAVFIAGAVGIAVMINNGFQLNDAGRPSAPYYVPMVEQLLRAQVEAIKAEAALTPPNTVTPGLPADQAVDWVPAIRVNNWWFYTQMILDPVTKTGGGATLQNWTVKVWARQAGAPGETFSFGIDANPTVNDATHWKVGETRFWRLVKSGPPYSNPIGI